MVTLFSIPEAELLQRQQRLRLALQARGLAGAVLFQPVNILYLANFAHLSTERPIALIIPVEGDCAALVPKLEEQHLQVQAPWLKHAWVYPEFPGKVHPMLHLVELLKSLGLANNPLGADHDGHLDQNGYFGPALSSLLGKAVQPAGDLVTAMRMVKTPLELELLRASGDWAARTHRYLQATMQAGISEREISRLAEEQAVAELDAAFGSAGHGGAIQVHASFRSGARTAISHAAMGSRPIQPGDNLVSYCQGILHNYTTELERTMFLGEPTPQQAQLFSVVRQAQELALEQIQPGMPCAEVDRQVQNFLEQEGYAGSIQHHQGHGLGLEFHEGPFLDVGDPTVLEAGMVLSVEPGLYLPGVGGFRHSDTVAVTETGYEILTHYPRDLADMVISI